MIGTIYTGTIKKKEHEEKKKHTYLNFVYLMGCWLKKKLGKQVSLAIFYNISLLLMLLFMLLASSLIPDTIFHVKNVVFAINAINATHGLFLFIAFAVLA